MTQVKHFAARSAAAAREYWLNLIQMDSKEKQKNILNCLFLFEA